MPKGLIEVQPASGKSYTVSIEQGKAIVSSGNGHWKGPRRIILAPDRSKRAIWEPKQSGYAGPLTLQLT